MEICGKNYQNYNDFLGTCQLYKGWNKYLHNEMVDSCPFFLYMNRDDILYEWSFNRINSSVDDMVINLNSDSTCVSESLVGLSKK